MGNLYEAIIDRLEEAKKETSFKDNDLIELVLMVKLYGQMILI